MMILPPTFFCDTPYAIPLLYPQNLPTPLFPKSSNPLPLSAKTPKSPMTP